MQFMVIYYWWKDVKEHESFVRAIAIAPWVGFFKGTLWPYFSFIHGKYVFKPEFANIDRKTEMSINGFFTGYEYFSNANELGSGTAEAMSLLKDFENIRTLLRKSKERLSECDIATLNTIYAGWGDMVEEKFLPAVTLLIFAIEPMGDRDDLLRANALIADCDTWMQNNWNGVVISLNSKYGYEYR